MSSQLDEMSITIDEQNPPTHNDYGPTGINLDTEIGPEYCLKILLKIDFQRN